MWIPKSFNELMSGTNRAPGNTIGDLDPRPARALGDLLSRTPPKAPAPAIKPSLHPDTVTLNILRKALLEDQKVLAGNPIVKQVVDRYVGIAVHVTDAGYPTAPVEPSTSFRTWINDLTVGHLERLKEKRLRLQYRRERKSAEKKAKQEGRNRFTQTNTQKRSPR